MEEKVPLPSSVGLSGHQLGAGLEVAQLEPKPAPTWNARTTGRSLTSYATALALLISKFEE